MQTDKIAAFLKLVTQKNCANDLAYTYLKASEWDLCLALENYRLVQAENSVNPINTGTDMEMTDHSDTAEQNVHATEQPVAFGSDQAVQGTFEQVDDMADQ